MSFNCRKCGKCCRDLLQPDMGILRGLTLLPEETRLFDEKQVRPYLGIGKHPEDKEFKTLAYQLKTEDCTNLSENLCKVYEDRPATCRQFPFSLDPDPEGGVLLGVDMNCPGAVELVNNSKGSFEFPEKDSAAKIYQLKNLVTVNPGNIWLYDLDKEQWVRFEA